MATCTDEDGRAGRGMSKEELARRKEELEKIASGKGAVSQTVHEWSFEGAQVSFSQKSLPLCRELRRDVDICRQKDHKTMVETILLWSVRNCLS